MMVLHLYAATSVLFVKIARMQWNIYVLIVKVS